MPAVKGELAVQLLETALHFIAGFCGLVLTGMMFYQMIIGLFGFGKKTKDYADHDPESRFLVLVPAHNEERVISDIVRNLQEMDYPKELYDFYVIADNCTDGTADAVRAAGGRVIETHKDSEDAPTGKPIALRKALEALGDYQNRYDLMMIFDADNLIDRNMFREVNSQYLDKGKPDLIQCYLGVKNKKGVVAWIDYTGFTLTNRFFGMAKQRLGLNCGIGGTGFAMSTSYLYERGGWTTRSLTEDFEIQVEATLEGRRILWNHETRVYDEKPTSLRATIRQKNRWGQGRWYVTFHETGNLFRAFFAGKISVWEFLSVFTHMYNGAVYVLLTAQLLCNGLLYLMGNRDIFRFDLGSTVLSILILTYSFFYLFYYAEWADNGIRFSLRSLPVTVASYLINIVVGFISQWYGLLRCGDQLHWAKTEHRIDAEDVSTRKPVQSPRAA